MEMKDASCGEAMENLQQQFNQALQMHQAGRIVEAIALYAALLPSLENNPQLLFLLGTARVQAGQHQPGLEMLKRVLALDPENPLAHINHGNGLQELGRSGEAARPYEGALAAEPDLVEVYNNRGSALLNLERPEEALASFERALALRPDYAEAYNNRGNALKALGRIGEALASYERSLALRPDAETYFNRGNALQAVGRNEEALAAFGQALALRPDYAVAHNNKGVVLLELNRSEEALAAFEQALALDAGYAEAHNNRGAALFSIKGFEEALAAYDRALMLDADYVEARVNRSVLLLLMGDYREGWEQYEWRLKQDADDYYSFPQPAWRGEQGITGKRILVHGEQGLGDIVHFCRYLPQLRALGAEIIFEVPKPLVSLVSTLDCPMTIKARGEDLPAFDTYCPLMSLPYAFKTTVETIPAQVPYLYADGDKVQQWRQRLGDTDRLRGGLVWSGSTSRKNPHRSMRLEDVLPLTGFPAEFHSLQVEYRQHDLDLLARHPEIRQHQHDLHDFADTAALIACMDLVISVCTGVAHVAGAMGKPVWIMLSYAADYRWLLDRDDSPWYATAKLFRQTAPGDWPGVIADVGAALQGLEDAA